MSEPTIEIIEAGENYAWTIRYGGKQVAWVSPERHGQSAVNAVLDVTRNLAAQIGVEVEEKWEDPSW